MDIDNLWLRKLDAHIERCIENTLAKYCNNQSFFWHNTRKAPSDRCNTCPSEGDFCAYLFRELSLSDIDGIFLSECPKKCTTSWLHSESRIGTMRTNPKHDILICNPYSPNSDGNAETLRIIEVKLSFDDLLTKSKGSDRITEELRHIKYFEDYFKGKYGSLDVRSFLVVVQGHTSPSSHRRDKAIEKLKTKTRGLILFYADETFNKVKKIYLGTNPA